MRHIKESDHGLFPASQALSLDHLTGKRQEIIRPVLESPRDFVLLNVRDMARRLGTGSTTIVRIVQALGFPSYKDFQHYLHDLSVTSATILDSMRATGNTAQTPGFLRDSRKQIQQNLAFVHDHVDLHQVLKIAHRIHKANRILLLGGDMASSLVNYMEYHLT
ncbi:MAG TPA: MurR/RpiR family transcriptional regulator, partial [Edaphobacter sp.]|nr:MurR/RpiR family transcriptional regulator [Edaphobacter sp.]